MQPKRRASMDGVVRRTPVGARPGRLQPEYPPQQTPAGQASTPVASVAASGPPPAARKKTVALSSPPPQARQRTSLWQRLQLPLTIFVGLIVGFFMQSLVFGMAIIALYGLLAVIFKVQSRVTFVLAFLSLVAVVLLLVVKRNPEQSGNFATYTFLLLVVGAVSLFIESRAAHPRYKRR